MADTERLIATLLATQFADGQAAGAITPQDIRDLLVSLQPIYGGCYISSAGATTISAVDTATKIAGTTTALADLNNVAMSTDNRLRNDSAVARICTLHASLDLVSANANKVFGLGFAKNGTFIAATEVRCKVLVATDPVKAHITHTLELAATDYVEAFIINRTDADNPTVSRMVFTMTGFAA